MQLILNLQRSLKKILMNYFWIWYVTMSLDKCKLAVQGVPQRSAHRLVGWETQSRSASARCGSRHRARIASRQPASPHYPSTAASRRSASQRSARCTRILPLATTASRARTISTLLNSSKFHFQLFYFNLILEKWDPLFFLSFFYFLVFLR